MEMAELLYNRIWVSDWSAYINLDLKKLIV
jgi:hypothetical protein